MEGPSIFLAAEQLAPFINKKILTVYGNTKINKERLLGRKILAIIPFGKQLFFQFETFALRVHFLIYGSFEATINEKKVTGDYAPRKRQPRLAIQLKNGHVEMYNCSVLFVEISDIKSMCDFSIDIMASEWDANNAYAKIKEKGENEIGDVLLDQDIFAGVGNIIKNEVLLLAGILPTTKVKVLSKIELKNIITITREFVFNFLKWHKKFELKKHYKIYRQSLCKQCGNKVIRKKTGLRQRISFFCDYCQK